MAEVRLQIQGLSEFHKPEDAESFLARLHELLPDIPGLAMVHVSLERSLKEEKLVGVGGLVVFFSYGLRLVIAQDSRGFWSSNELCPVCNGVRKAQVCQEDGCSYQWAEGSGSLRFEDFVAPAYEDNTYSGIVKESREKYEELARAIALRLELAGADPLNGLLLGQETVAALRACIDEWSAPHRIGFAWGAADS